MPLWGGVEQRHRVGAAEEPWRAEVGQGRCHNVAALHTPLPFWGLHLADQELLCPVLSVPCCRESRSAASVASVPAASKSTPT